MNSQCSVGFETSPKKIAALSVLGLYSQKKEDRHAKPKYKENLNYRSNCGRGDWRRANPTPRLRTLRSAWPRKRPRLGRLARSRSRNYWQRRKSRGLNSTEANAPEFLRGISISD